ncbi:TIGR03826 family flagellar region protein [Metabacillus malikii]|uniref:Flagellar operon protein (TIGR03826 family) n=1 Tax=Metabacillus malikii TaxID=1504265 RepID=A0ABT9ZGS5_9BACI|nr:TIGR03826 family flagellar region protein [Metabacillus malikii]MDQ0231449.1 flagellar operon protein (TIGR03826 family) [Metabacillus malikii]
MGELSNCPKCNTLFVKTQFRTVCDACFKEEELAYETVYKFLRKRENRKALLHEVVEDTGVAEELILKFIRNGRIQLSNFPNLGYPCEKCGKVIREDRLCSSCKIDINQQLHQMDEEKRIIERNKPAKVQSTYYSQSTKK